MDSFIAWIGGKKLLRKTIIEKFPTDMERYIEVFGGAGWVLFGKEPKKQFEVFNDMDGDLINLYRCIKYHCQELQRELEWVLLSREQFFDYKNQLESRGLTDIQRAARYFLVIKLSFGADRKSFGIHTRGVARTIAYLEKVKERLQDVVIENRDFEKIIKTYDRPEALFYLDPPYLGTEKFYENPFTIEDHKRLNHDLTNIKGRFILSYNDDERIKELYTGFHIETIERNNNLTSKNKVSKYNELIITNF